MRTSTSRSCGWSIVIGSMRAGAPRPRTTTPCAARIVGPSRPSGSAVRPWFVTDAHASVRSMDVVGLRDLVAPRRDEFLAHLEAMVNVDSGSYTPDGANEIVDLGEERFREWGWTVDGRRARFGDERLGDLLIGRLDGSGGRRILLVGHTDTVFAAGTARGRAVSVDGGGARGAGGS